MHKKKYNRATRRNKHILLLFVALVGICAAGVFISRKNALAPSKENANSSAVQHDAVNKIEDVVKKGNLRVLSGVQFRDLYNNFAYPNTERISDDTPIMGNVEADKRIRSLAQSRGYMIRSAPVTNTFIDVGSGMLLQQRAAQPWLDMQAAARKDGHIMNLSAAYRSAEDQKQIFLGRIAGISPAAVANGSSDNKIKELLRTTALPGYSRHHNGYAIDIECDSDPGLFEKSDCFAWLQADNYKHAKEHGWIPSYPDGAGPQGPDPESWEYVWVGVDTLTE